MKPIRMLLPLGVVGICLWLSAGHSSGLPAASVGAAASGDRPSADTAASLAAEVNALRPQGVHERIHFGAPFDLPPGFAVRVGKLRQKIEQYTRSHSGKALDLDWRMAVQDGFMLSCISEWNTYETARRGLTDGWNLLTAARPADARCIPDIAVRLASLHLKNWARAEPEKCIEVIAEAQKRFGSQLSTGEKSGWEWVLDRIAEELQRTAKDLPPERGAAVLQYANARIEASIRDETRPLAHRTNALAMRARSMYSEGRMEDAAARLNEWWQRHGDKIPTLDFYNIRFFVAYLGQGDRETARDMLQRATALAEKKVFSEKDGHYKLMVAAYYSKLPLTDLELRRQAHQNMMERRTRNGNANHR